MPRQEVVIRNEAEAWYWLSYAHSGATVADDVVIRFDGWPTVRLDFEGRDFHSSVPSRVMPPILDLQKELHRAYCLLKYGEDNVRKLTNDDRDASEIVVNVGDGSSIFEVQLSDQLNNIVGAVLGKMGSQEVLFAVTSLALLYAGHASWKAWLTHKAREKEIDLPLRMSEEETKRTELLSAALVHREPIRVLADGMDEVRNHALYRMKPADRLMIPHSDIALDGGTAARISHAPRVESEEVRIDGEFKIFSVDSGNMSGYRIKVYRITDGLELSVRIPDAALSLEEREILKTAEWDKTRVLLRINARELRGKITSAALVSVKIAGHEPPRPEGDDSPVDVD